MLSKSIEFGSIELQQQQNITSITLTHIFIVNMDKKNLCTCHKMIDYWLIIKNLIIIIK